MRCKVLIEMHRGLFWYEEGATPEYNKLAWSDQAVITPWYPKEVPVPKLLED